MGNGYSRQAEHRNLLPERTVVRPFFMVARSMVLLSTNLPENLSITAGFRSYWMEPTRTESEPPFGAVLIMFCFLLKAAVFLNARRQIIRTTTWNLMLIPMILLN